MGLDNRDYIRQSPHPSAFGGGGAWPPVIKALLAINVAVFLLQLFSTPPTGQTSPVQSWLQLDGRQVFAGQVWRLLTYAFCHSTAQFFHIVMNMFFLVMFGRELERRYGSAEFLAFYLVAAIVSAFAFLGLQQITGRLNPVIGASGSAMAVMVLFACLYPRRVVLLWLVLPVQIRWIVAFLIVIDLLPALAALGGRDFKTGIAHAAHLGGMAFAFVYWKTKVRLAPFFHKVSPVRPKSGGKQGTPKPRKSDLSTTGRSKAEIDQQVDALLQKISDKGFQSLTEKEKKFLEKASDKFGR